MTDLTYDFASGGKAKKDQWGFFKVPATLTKPGVYTYVRNGKLRRELKPPDEVFAPTHIESVRNAIVTEGHPSEVVNPSNSSKFTRGSADSNVEKVDGSLVTDLKINDENLINAIETRKKCQLSLGLSCDFDETPGTWRGINGDEPPQEYDVVQRNMVTNHIAVLSQGRVQGAQLHLDSGAGQMVQEETKMSETNTTQIKLDGTVITLDSGNASFVTQHITKLQGQLDSANLRLKELSVKDEAMSTLQAGFDQQKQDLEKLQLTHDEMIKSLPELVKKRNALLQNAAKIFPKEKLSTLDSMTDEDVRKTVCQYNDSTVDLTEDAAYFRGRFDAMCKSYDPAKKFTDQIANHQGFVSDSADYRTGLNERMLKAVSGGTE